MRYLRMLGAYGGRGDNRATTSVMVSENIVIDAGNIMAPLGNFAGKIDYIFLTHCHLDHIVDIPFLIDAFYTQRETPITILGLKETLATLKTHILNWDIWPDFNEIKLINKTDKSIVLREIEIDETVTIGSYDLKAIKTNHTVPSCGYAIRHNGRTILFTSDTCINDEVWEQINGDESIFAAIIDCSFPSTLEQLALDSRHLTPRLLSSELTKLRREIQTYIFHIKPSFEAQIKAELDDYENLSDVVVLRDGDRIFY